MHATVRFTPKRYADLRKAADDNRRSLSEEVEVRIERSFSPAIDDFETELIGALNNRIKDLQQQLEQNAFTEEAIERAVVRAFARMGGLK